MLQEAQTPNSNSVSILGEDLRYAARTGDKDTVQAILNRIKETTSVNAELLTEVLSDSDSLSGNKALHLSAANGHVELVRQLLEHNADINAQNMSGSTALHYAALNGQLETMKELIRSHADLVVENKYGKTALDEARVGRDQQVAEFLIDYVKKAGETPDLSKESEGEGAEGSSTQNKN